MAGKALIQQMEVYNEDEKKFITVTAEQQRLAAYVHQQVVTGSIITSIALKKIRDEKLYSGLGCSSFEEYCSTMLPFGKRTAYRYLKIADKIEIAFPVFKQLNADNRNSDNSQNSDNVVTSDEMSEMQNIGLAKLYEITKLDDEEFKELVKGGKLGENGELSIGDIMDMTAREASKKIAEFRKKYQEKLSIQGEKIKKLEDEKKALAERNEELEEDIEIANEKEKLFGGAATSYEVKLTLLNDAEEHFERFVKYINNANIKPDDTDNLQKKFVGLIKKMADTHGYMLISYQEVTANFGV